MHPLSTRIILISILLFIHISATTLPSGISNKNCPIDFDIASANFTTDSNSKTLIDFLYGSIYSADDQTTIQNSITSGNTGGLIGYATSLQILLPFVIVAIAFLVTFVLALCCCVFQKTCPPCQSWKRDFVRRPYQKFEMRCVTIFSVLFAVGIFLTTIMGFVYFPQLKQNITMTKCSIYYTLDVAINGDQTNKWGGFTQLKSQIGNVSNLLSTASTSINTNLAGNDWLSTGMTTLIQMNMNIYTNNYQSMVKNPNPITITPYLTPQFIGYGLGPNGTNNTMVNDIDQGLQVTTKVSNQGYKVYKAAFLLANSANNISANANIAIAALNMNSNYLDAASASINKFTQAIFDKIFNWGLYLIQGILGFVMAGSLLMLLGISATHGFELYSCKTSVHLGWVAYGITYFGIVVISFIFLALGGISYSFCQFYGGLVTSNSSYVAYTQSSSSSQFNRLFAKLNVCFYGDGNIMKQFTISNEMQTVSNLFSQIGLFQNMRDSTNIKYVNTAYSTTKITGWINAMQNYRIGLYVDADPGLTNDDNPHIAIKTFTTYTNNQRGGIPPSCTNDYWVWDSTNCTHNATESVYTSAVANSGTTFATTGTTCISFNQKFANNSNAIWRIDDIANRYVPRRQCQNNTANYDEIIKYATSLIDYRDSRINLYKNIKDQLTALLTQNNNFNTQLTAFTTKVNTFYSSVSTLNNLVTSQINGLDSSSNCTVIANNLRFIYNTFCVNFLYKSVQFGICCIVLLAIMVGGTITGSVFGIRYGRIQKQKRTVMPQIINIQQLHSQTFQKRHQSSSSSSSDED